jgi:hypothetical protein
MGPGPPFKRSLHTKHYSSYHYSDFVLYRLCLPVLVHESQHDQPDCLYVHVQEVAVNLTLFEKMVNAKAKIDAIVITDVFHFFAI